MKRIEGAAVESIREHFEEAAFEARRATCLRAKCGSVIVSKSGIMLGAGFNAPPLGDETQRMCMTEFTYDKRPKYDKTCCVHAEWNAALDAQASVSEEQLAGSRLYFMRVDSNGDFTDAGEPYCTVCSRITMQAGVAEFALWNNNGADIYPIDEYNQISYEYFKKHPDTRS